MLYVKWPETGKIITIFHCKILKEWYTFKHVNKDSFEYIPFLEYRQ